MTDETPALPPEVEIEIAEKEQRASEAIANVEATNREAEVALRDFWSIIREARSMVAQQGVPMPEALDRSRREGG